MRIHHYIFLGLGFFLLIFGIASIIGEQSSEDEISSVEAKDLQIGEYKFVDDRKIYDHAQHIFLESNNLKEDDHKSAVLLFHGYLATPQEVSELATYLHERGHTVLAPLMPGHGSNPQDLLEVSYKEWESEAIDYYQALNSNYDEVNVIGFSLGSLNALSIAQQFEVKGKVVAIGPPIYFSNGLFEVEKLSEGLEMIVEYVPEISKPGGFTDDLIGRETYEIVPLENVEEVFDYSIKVSDNLMQVDEEILLIHGRYDLVADPQSSEFVFENVASEKKEIVEIDSLHPVLMGIHKTEVFEIIANFIEN